MLVEKLPDLTLSENEFIKFQRIFQILYICPEKLTGKLAQQWPRITLEHMQDNALRVIAFARQRGEMAGRAPEEARRRRQMTLNIIFGRT